MGMPLSDALVTKLEIMNDGVESSHAKLINQTLLQL